MIGEIIGGIVGAGASVANNIANIKMQEKINKENKEWQEKENNIMRQREDNAITRRAADLKNAGINQMIAGIGGAGANAGVTHPMIAPQIDGQATSKGIEGIIAGLTVKKLKAEIANVEQDTSKKGAETSNIENTTGEAKNTFTDRAETVKIMNNNLSKDLETKNTAILNTLENTELIKQNKLLANAQTQLAKTKDKTEQQKILETAKQIEMLSSQITSEKEKQELINAQKNATEIQIQEAYKKMEEITQKIENMKSEKKITDQDANTYMRRLIYNEIRGGTGAVADIIRALTK